MKNIKMILFGIALILFGIFASILSGQAGDYDFLLTIIIGFGVFSPIVGLILCAVGFFRKDDNSPR